MLLLANTDHQIIDLNQNLKLHKLCDRRSIHLARLRHRIINFNKATSLSHIYVPVLPVNGRVSKPAFNQRGVFVLRTEAISEDQFSEILFLE